LRDEELGNVIYRPYPYTLLKRSSGGTFLSDLRWYVLNPPGKG